MKSMSPAPLADERPSPVVAFVRMGRFKFLFQSLLVVGFAVTVSVHGGHGFSVRWYAITVLFAWCAHLMTHYCNEYFDLEADTANDSPTSWTGGSRVLVNRFLDPVVSLSAAFVLLFLAVVLVAVMPSTMARVIAVLILMFAWFYTAPPLRLNYHALGEITCASVLYALGPVLAFHLQADGLSRLLLTCVAVVFVLQVLRCLIMNLFDIEGDLRVGKKTQAGILTADRVVRVYPVGQFVTYCGLVVLVLVGMVPLLAGLAMIATFPAPLWVSWQLLAGTTNATRANLVTLWSSLQLPLMSSAITVGLIADMIVHGRTVPVLWLVLSGASLALFAVWAGRTVLPVKRPR